MSIIDHVIEDLREVPVCLVSRRGWGKSSSVKTIIERLLRKYPDTIVKIFDSSLSWYFKAPVSYRQLVTREKIEADQVSNIGSCVYTLRLDREDKRAFIASIVEADFRERFDLALKYGEDTLKGLPMILYVIEESNLVLSSSSLLREDIAGEVLNSFISEFRNLGFAGGLFVTTRLRELSTGIRERSKLLIGKVYGEGDLRLIKAVTDTRTRDLCKGLAKYHFIYDHQVERIPDTCTRTPKDWSNPIREKTVRIRPKAGEVPTKAPARTPQVEVPKDPKALTLKVRVLSFFLSLPLIWFFLRVLSIFSF